MYFSISIQRAHNDNDQVRRWRHRPGKEGGRPSAASSTSRVSLTLASFPPARPRLQHLYFDLELGALIALTLGIISLEEKKLVL